VEEQCFFQGHRSPTRLVGPCPTVFVDLRNFGFFLVIFKLGAEEGWGFYHEAKK